MADFTMSDQLPLSAWVSSFCLLHPTNNPPYSGLIGCTDNLFLILSAMALTLSSTPWRPHLVLGAPFLRILFVFFPLLKKPSVPRFQDVHVFDVLACDGLPTNFLGEITARWNILPDKPLNNLDLGMSPFEPVVEV